MEGKKAPYLRLRGYSVKWFNSQRAHVREPVTDFSGIRTFNNFSCPDITANDCHWRDECGPTDMRSAEDDATGRYPGPRLDIYRFRQ
jgi:hypothetical protein